MSKNFDTIWDVHTSNCNGQTDGQDFCVQFMIVGHIKLINRSLKNVEAVLWSFCIERLLTNADRRILMFLSGSTRMRFSILSFLHRYWWRSFFLLYLLFVALLRPVGFLLQNRENVASNTNGNLVTR